MFLGNVAIIKILPLKGQPDAEATPMRQGDVPGVTEVAAPVVVRMAPFTIVVLDIPSRIDPTELRALLLMRATEGTPGDEVPVPHSR